MPIAQVHILTGRTPEQQKKLIESVTTAISESLDVPRGRVRVLIYEVAREHWGVGGVPRSEDKDYLHDR